MRSILDRLMKALGDTFLDGEIHRPTRIWVTVKREDICSVAKILKEDFGVTRLATITGVETSNQFELFYHFERLNEVQLNELITIKLQVSREDPLVNSIVSVMPSAYFYELELRDLFGIEPKGHPFLTRLFVAEVPSSTEYPLRKRVPSVKPREPVGT